MKLLIEIELGNDAMRNNLDVKDCLLRSRCIGQTGSEDYTVGESGNLSDVNGNTVGKWKVVRSGKKAKGSSNNGPLPGLKPGHW